MYVPWLHLFFTGPDSHQEFFSHLCSLRSDIGEGRRAKAAFSLKPFSVLLDPVKIAYLVKFYKVGNHSEFFLNIKGF